MLAKFMLILLITVHIIIILNIVIIIIILMTFVITMVQHDCEYHACMLATHVSSHCMELKLPVSTLLL